MATRRKKHKRPKKKRGHQPSGLKVLHDDRDIIVVSKNSGLLTVSSDKERDRTAYSAIGNYVRKGVAKSSNRVFIVHRLDRETSGVLVFAKTPEAKRFLQDSWGEFRKSYLAVVHGEMSAEQGRIESYLAESGVHKMVSTSDPKAGKKSITDYRVLQKSERCSLLEINLLTGRKHQIRVHLADSGHAVVGDKKYGPPTRGEGVKGLALHATSLTLRHPHSKEEMTFTSPMPSFFEKLMRSGS